VYQPPSFEVLACPLLADPYLWFKLTGTLVLTGNQAAVLCVGPLISIRSEHKSPELSLTRDQMCREKALVLLSREMVNIQMSGKVAYKTRAEQAKQKDRRTARHAGGYGWVGDDEIEDQISADPDLSMLSSALFRVAGRRLSCIRGNQKTQIQLEAEDNDFVCLHSSRTGSLPPTICLLVTRPENKCPARWEHLGSVTMAVLKRATTLREWNQYTIHIDWGETTGAECRCAFVSGMSSLNFPGKIAQAPGSPLAISTLRNGGK
jgi:hypothetical protein